MSRGKTSRAKHKANRPAVLAARAADPIRRARNVAALLKILPGWYSPPRQTGSSEASAVMGATPAASVKP
jgi:hypothetical protein